MDACPLSVPRQGPEQERLFPWGHIYRGQTKDLDLPGPRSTPEGACMASQSHVEAEAVKENLGGGPWKARV